MIRAHQDLLAMDRKEMTDDVLYNLLKMGILELGGPKRLSQPNYPGDATLDSDDDVNAVEGYAIGGQGKVS